MELAEIREALKAMYGGENHPITDGNYDKSLAVKRKKTSLPTGASRM